MPIVFNNSNAANVQTPSVDKTTLFIANTQLATKDANGNVTYYNAGGNGSPGGVTTSVQFNNSGAFAGNSAFTYDEANATLLVTNISVSGNAQISNVNISKISNGNSNVSIPAANGTITTSVPVTSNPTLSSTVSLSTIGQLNFTSPSSTTNSIFNGESYRNAARGGGFAFSRGRGTKVAPLSLQPGDEVGQIFFSPHNGTTVGNDGSSIRAIVDSSYVANQSVVPVNLRINLPSNVGNVTTYSPTYFYSNGSFAPAGNIVTIANSDHQLGNSVTSNTFIGNLSATGVSNLGSNSNVIITGCTAGYVLSTNGSGNLSWVAQTGGGGGGNTDWANIGNITNAYGPNNIFIGASAGNIGSEFGAIAIGNNAGNIIQRGAAIAIGLSAGGAPGGVGQGISAIAIGAAAGSYKQGILAIGIGVYAGLDSQGSNSIAIGFESGSFSQGNNAIAIGTGAGHQDQHDNTTILNATGANLNSTQANSLYISPIRNDTSNTANSLYYNTSTKEVTYGPGGGGPGRIAAIYVYTRSSGTVQVPVTGGYLNVVGRSAIIPIPVN
jgi:hypothetical protein